MKTLFLLRKSKKFYLFAAAILLVAGILFARMSHYGYDAMQDYAYDFSRAQMQIISGHIAKNRLILDAPLAGYDTILAEIVIERAVSGYVIEPTIQISSSTGSILQAMEKGGAGRRYLNLSTLFPVGEQSEFVIQAKHLILPDQTVRLLCFRNNIDVAKRILVMAPHPDDAEIAAFGFYASHPNVWIATVTAGDAGKNTYDEVYSQRPLQAVKKGELRVWNSMTVPQLGKVPPHRAINLGYYDHTLAKMYSSDHEVQPQYAKLPTSDFFRRFNVSRLLADRPFTPSWQGLVGDLKTLITKVKPDLILSPFPKIDSHPDHKYTTLALLEALEHLDERSASLLLYTNHCVTSDYAPLGPMYSTVSLPPAFDGQLGFDRIYSWPLTRAQQQDKYFALEAMNDLRQDTEWLHFWGLLKQLGKQGRDAITAKNFSYFRRAVRKDEIFFVFDLKKQSLAKIRTRISHAIPVTK